MPSLDASNSLLIVKPDPYELDFEPRSEVRKQEMRANWAQSDAQDKKERADFVTAARKARETKVEAESEPLIDMTTETSANSTMPGVAPIELSPVVAVS